MKKSVVLLVCLFNLCFAILYEDDPCELAYDEPGKCVRLSQCPSAINLVISRQHPKTCSYIRNIPIVCCPLSGALFPRVSERLCQSYRTIKIPTTTTTTTTTTTLKPGTLQIFVIGGINVQSVKEFPHMAALGFSSSGIKLWLCGGSLISESFVLTAAHCLHSTEYGPLEWVRLGNIDLSIYIGDYSPVDYAIRRRIPHPRYKVPSSYHDIGLLELSNSAILMNNVKPACLPAQPTIDPQDVLVATGWGLTEFAGRRSDFLQKVDLELFTEQECEEAYKDLVNTRKLKDGIVHERMFCAGGRNEEKDTCQGDSGGPLQVKIDGSFTIVGITSFGKSCGIANLPGVYTKVAPYVPWIENIVWPDEF